VKNDRGIITGISQTALPDPLGERWSCSAFFPAPTAVGHQCLGFAWQDGVMRALPTLGGTNGFATGANNRGEIVGWAENTVHDPTCVPPQVLQFRAVVWGPAPGQIRELPPLSGDTVSAATALNDRGQVVGISGICDRAVGRFSAIHAVLWQDGKPIDLGSLGGVAWNTPMSINERGDVVGFANASAAAGSFDVHAFLWTRRGGMRDLGTLPGDSTSQALGINDRREIVGTSCDAAFNCRAVIWRNGAITDLNTLMAPDYEDTLTTANDINESGRFTGQAFEPATGKLVAFVARRG
jgi:probable HAF family extracellular repeat protein